MGEPAKGYLVSRSSLARAGVGLIFATLYTAPHPAPKGMRTGFEYQTAHEASLAALAEVNYYRTCGLQIIRTRGDSPRSNREP